MRAERLGVTGKAVCAAAVASGHTCHPINHLLFLRFAAASDDGQWCLMAPDGSSDCYT